MPDATVKKEIEILSKKELDRTIKRLASQILEKIPLIDSLLLIGIPTRGVYLSKLLAKYLLISTLVMRIFHSWHSKLLIIRTLMQE